MQVLSAEDGNSDFTLDPITKVNPNDEVYEFEFRTPIMIPDHDEVSINVMINLSDSVASGSTLGIKLNELSATNATVTINHISQQLTYLDEIPKQIIIDGAFGDWWDVPKCQDIDENIMANSNLDIQDYAIQGDEEKLNFYFSVGGELLATINSPIHLAVGKNNYIKEPIDYKVNTNTLKPQPQRNLPPELIARDRLHIFLDIDQNVSTGYQADWLHLGAEYMVQVTGRNGVINNHALNRYSLPKQIPNGSAWSWQFISTTPVAKDLSQLEASIDIDNLGIDIYAGVDVCFILSNWDTSITDSSENLNIQYIPHEQNHINDNFTTTLSPENIVKLNNGHYSTRASDPNILINEIMYKPGGYDWPYRKRIIINSQKVNGDLTDFPVLINITDSDLKNKSRSDGYDIYFTQSDGETKLDHEIEYFDNSNGKLEAWVRIPALSSTSDTLIYMHYGNPTTNDQSNVSGVWINNYSAVWHLDEDPTDSAPQFKDSTTNYNNGTAAGVMTAADQVPGKINGSIDFDGTDDGINITQDSSLDLSTNVTISGWFKLDSIHDSTTTASKLIIGKHLDNDYNMAIVLAGTDWLWSDPGALVFKLNKDDANGWRYKWTSRRTWAANTWYNFVCFIDQNNNANNRIYVNSIDDTGNNQGASTDLDLDYAADWYIGGGDVDTANIVAGVAYFDGILDEIRVSNIERSDDWITTEYNNQNSSGSFYFIGQEEIIGYQWVELNNAESYDVNLIGWNLTDNDGNYFNLSGAGDITAGGYLICHLGQSGTNSSTDVYGPPENMLETADDLSILNSTDVVVEYVAWGANPGADDDNAVSAGQWTNNEFVDTSELLFNETIGRDKDSTDADSTSDWEHPLTNKADPYGVNATSQTPGTQNLDPYEIDYGDMVINEIMFNYTNSGWLYRKKISIKASKVTDNLANFPVLISVMDPDLINKAQPDGDDIYFTGSDGKTRLKHQIESYNSGTGKLVAWVKIPSLSSSSNTELYMYYGNATASDQSDTINVWDSNYVGVWHLNETGTGTRFDSTSYYNNGTTSGYNGDEATTGKIDGADDLNGINDYINIDSVTIDLDSTFTVSVWMKADSTIDSAMVGFNDNSANNIWRLEMIGNVARIEGGAGTTVISDGAWHHVVGLCTGSKTMIYVDGELDRDNIAETPTISDSDLASIGQEYDGGPTPTDFFNGTLDEVRISKIVRNASWIETEFNNQNKTYDFYTIYREETVGYQWIELYNAENSSLNLTGWYISDNDGNRFNLSGAGDVPSNGYLMCHLGQSGTNSSINLYGPPANMLENSDDLILMDNNGNIIDYVAWGGNPGTDDDSAAIAGQWTNGEYVDTSQLLQNETIGRDKNSTDTNSPTDWENSSTSRADPYGINATHSTPGTQNIDHIIPEFDFLALPILTILILILLINRSYYFNSKKNQKPINKKPRKNG
jgi:hypothetical protein